MRTIESSFHPLMGSASRPWKRLQSSTSTFTRPLDKTTPTEWAVVLVAVAADLVVAVVEWAAAAVADLVAVGSVSNGLQGEIRYLK